MPIVRMTFEEARKRAEENPVDWTRIDAMTDEDIARQIAEDPDVAPDMSQALERGEFFRVYTVGLYGIRTDMGLSHEAFAARFGLNRTTSGNGRRAAGRRTRRSARICR